MYLFRNMPVVMIFAAQAYALLVFIMYRKWFSESADNLAAGVTRLFWPGDASFRIVPEYSVAEARIKQGKYVEAIAEFRKVIEKHPGDVFPHVRIAEIHEQILQDPKAAEAELKTALTKPITDEAWAIVAHKLADLYQFTMKNPQLALDILREIRLRQPDSKHARLADERIASLVEALGSPVLPQSPATISLKPSRYRG